MIFLLFTIFINTHYGKIHLEIKGTGSDTVVMLHGWLDSWFVYHRIIPYLSDDYTLVLPDMPGHGDSDNSPHGYQPMLLASSILEVLDSLHLGKYYLLGHSLGAEVAALMAWADRERVKKLILLTPANTESHRLSCVQRVSFSYPFIWCIAGCMTPGLFTVAKKMTLYYDRKKFDYEHSKKMFRDDFSSWKERMESVKITRQSIGVEKFNPIIIKSAGVDAMVIFAKHDHLIKTKVMKDFEKAGIPVMTMESSGHLVQIEAPYKLSNIIKEFFRR